MINHSIVSEEFSAQKRNYNFHDLLPTLLRSMDFLTVFFGFAFFPNIINILLSRPVVDMNDYALVGGVVSTLFVMTAQFFALYNRDCIFNTFKQMKGVVCCWLFVWAILLCLAFALKTSSDYSRITMVLVFSTGVPVLMGTRAALHHFFKFALAKKIIRAEAVAVMNFGFHDDVHRNLSKKYDVQYTKSLGLNGAGFSTCCDDESMNADIKDFLKRASSLKIDKIVLALPFKSAWLLSSVLPQLRYSPLPVLMVTDAWLTGVMPGQVKGVGNYSIVELSKPPMTLSERLLKRMFDTLVALVSLILLSPIMLCVALAVKLDSSGSVFFKQKRLGFNHQMFSIYKFRSMTVMEDGYDVVQAKRGDQRVTRVGKFIRATSLDELPQLFNVLCGHMSLVGPRPHALAHDKHYDALISDYSRRRHMKPGLTGWAQVNGYRGETPTIEAMQARVEHDLWYIQNWSLWLDIWIILKTVHALMKNRNVY